MKKIIIFVLLIVSCQSKTEQLTGHRLKKIDDKLEIKYYGEGDVVEFKMFEGLNRILKKNSDGIFEGQLEIPDLDDGIFSYEILVHKKDKDGKMIVIDYKSDTEDGRHFIWTGKKRNIIYKKSDKLNGELFSTKIKSRNLEQERSLTIYTPSEIKKSTPIIYFTDGVVVEYYAPFIDKLITENKISPIKLVGIHSSKENRYKEYVDNGLENVQFKKHESFFYDEVMEDIEQEISGWNGKRYIYGFSNGAAFCMHAGINYPEKFEEVIAFSTADYISEFIKPIEFRFEKYPKFYMGAGRYENRIYKNNLNFLTKMKNNQITVEFKEFISGHDYNVWRVEFFKYLENRFKK